MFTVLWLIALFGIVHSLLAMVGIKALFVTLMGQRGYLGFYRLFYNTFSIITFAPIVLYVLAQPGEVLWSASGVGLALLSGVALAGLAGLTVSLLQIDLLRFLGVSQALAYLESRPLPLPPEGLVTGGTYALTRHPLYFFSMLVLWGVPVMTESWFALAAGSSAYFVVGSLLEERRMVRQFGAAYEDYQSRVAWMIPFLKG